MKSALFHLLPTSFARRLLEGKGVSFTIFLTPNLFYQNLRSFMTLSLAFLPFAVFLLRFLCPVYPLVKSLYLVNERKFGYYGIIFYSVLCWDLLDIVLLASQHIVSDILNILISIWYSCSCNLADEISVSF